MSRTDCSRPHSSTCVLSRDKHMQYKIAMNPVTCFEPLSNQNGSYVCVGYVHQTARRVCSRTETWNLAAQCMARFMPHNDGPEAIKVGYWGARRYPISCCCTFLSTLGRLHNLCPAPVYRTNVLSLLLQKALQMVIGRQSLRRLIFGMIPTCCEHFST